jgi:hypothetical protein
MQHTPGDSTVLALNPRVDWLIVRKPASSNLVNGIARTWVSCFRFCHTLHVFAEQRVLVRPATPLNAEANQ